MKKLILAVIVMGISSMAVADPDRSFSNSIADIEGIQFIYDELPGMYSHIFNEWQQTNINKSVALRADKAAKENTKSIVDINSDIDDLGAGIAGAMAAASLPVANKGSDSFMVGAGIYNGEAAIAVGISGNSEDGKIIKFSFTADTAGNSGASAGASFAF